MVACGYLSMGPITQDIFRMLTLLVIPSATLTLPEGPDRNQYPNAEISLQIVIGIERPKTIT